MGKLNRNPKAKPNPKPAKHKQIANGATKPAKAMLAVKPAGKQLFQIVNETEGADGEDAFAALAFQEEVESEEEEQPQVKIKNKFKQQKEGKNGKKAKKEVTPEES